LVDSPDNDTVEGFPKQPLPDRIHALIFEFAYHGRRDAIPLLTWLLEIAWEIEGKEIYGYSYEVELFEFFSQAKLARLKEELPGTYGSRRSALSSDVEEARDQKAAQDGASWHR
jgi:hypothetical protein